MLVQYYNQLKDLAADLVSHHVVNGSVAVNRNSVPVGQSIRAGRVWLVCSWHNIVAVKSKYFNGSCLKAYPHQ